ncbi:MAG TPA: UDP-N-acetylmuramoyl-L-alanyl-D-glutamate--2,6-diaminopimelate ligase [Acidimicrobiaceae bacterium]|nr:UDP-N-acetylmuramoyl-L-alanyl-D-glutamate--2,6-diaminopimelate ligase [Acidimicrobiaceae bacterium]
MDRLLEGVELLDTSGALSDTEVTSVELDSGRVAPGALFFCVPGRRHDGHDFAPAAVEAGAVGLLVERSLALDVPQARVPPGSMRPAMARVSSAFYGHPARSLLTVGVTGTNGKTTVTHLLGSIFEAHGLPTSVIGTLSGQRTTPEAPELQRQLAAARDEGMQALSMEVSSHALTEARVDGITFSAAVFTNLSHEHLDHHGSMEAYFEAKASLFRPDRALVGVVNADDAWGRRLLELATIPTASFTAAEVSDVEATRDETAFTWHGRRVRLQLRGDYHVANALAAATTAHVLDVPDDAVVAGLETAGPVPGRFEVVDADAPFTVVVDYAHTPDGLETALRSARRLAQGGRVVCVFGCGGERDTAKRPAMGAVAETGADVVVLTSDNPRSEDPTAIIEAVVSGMSPGAPVTLEPDRRAAIALAVEAARPGDVVVIAGKGHEDSIEIAGRHLPFDDRAEAAAAVVARRGAGHRRARP